MTERENLTPKEIVAQLNKYIIGQDGAKKSVAVALRNRWRRKKLSAELQKEIIPKNILLIGPTGVGKTEIARRLGDEVYGSGLRWPRCRTNDSRFVDQCHSHGSGTGKPTF